MKNESILKGNILFEKYIRKNIVKYIVVILVYTIGFIMGIGIFNDKIVQENELSQISNYVIEGINEIGQTNEMRLNYIKQDFIEVVIISIFSFSIIGVPVIIGLLFIKAISLGITVSALLYSTGAGTGMAFSILTFLVPTILKIFIVLILMNSSLKFIKNVLVYRKEIKYEIIRHAIVNLVSLLILIVNVLYRIFSLKIIEEIIL